MSGGWLCRCDQHRRYWLPCIAGSTAALLYGPCRRPCFTTPSLRPLPTCDGPDLQPSHGPPLRNSKFRRPRTALQPLPFPRPSSTNSKFRPACYAQLVTALLCGTACQALLYGTCQALLYGPACQAGPCLPHYTAGLQGHSVLSGASLHCRATLDTAGQPYT